MFRYFAEYIFEGKLKLQQVSGHFKLRLDFVGSTDFYSEIKSVLVQSSYAICRLSWKIIPNENFSMLLPQLRANHVPWLTLIVKTIAHGIVLANARNNFASSFRQIEINF